MVGLYTILTNPDKMKEGMTMIISGMIGIVFMYKIDNSEIVSFS